MLDLSFSISELELFLLCLVRISCFVYAAPLIGTTNVPNRVKIALSVLLTYLVYHFVEPVSLVSYSSVIEYAVIVAKEAVTGLIIGFGANICSNIVTFAGRIIDTEMGLSMMTIYDPTTRETVSLTGTFYNFMVMIILMISGLYQYLVKAIVESFTLIPVNGANVALAKLLTAFIEFMGHFFLVGFKVCLPVFCAIMILNAILGILVKVSPQINMFAVGHQLKILTGMGILFLTIGLLPYISSSIFVEIRKTVVAFVEALM